MAFVTFKLENGARQVDMVYATQAEANSAAQANTNLTAHTGNVNEDVIPGDFITSAGALLSAPPAAVRDKREEGEHRSQIQTAFLSYVAARPVWIPELSSANDQAGLKAADRWAIMTCALADQIVEGNYLSGQSRSTRNDFIEHLRKELADDPRAGYNRLRNLPKGTPGVSGRDAWAGVATSGGSAIYSDMVGGTLGQPKDPDGAFSAVSGVTIPAKFDPSQPTLRRP